MQYDIEKVQQYKRKRQTEYFVFVINKKILCWFVTLLNAINSVQYVNLQNKYKEVTELV